MLDSPASATLADLRADIDRIDAELHALLIARGEIIDRLIAIKGGAGSAFRPEREAEMMRHLVSRHRGILPLDTVESVWRIIISTFTYVQANYSVHADVSAGDAPMRDCCRFHFGFTVPYVPHHGTAAVVAAVAAAKGDLGLVAVSGGRGDWWSALLPPTAPKIIARLPFVERPDHPAGLPLFVIAKPLSEAASRDVVLYAVSASAAPHAAASADLAANGIEVIDQAKSGFGVSMLIAAPGALDAAALRAALGKAVEVKTIGELGSHAARFDLGTEAGAAR